MLTDRNARPGMRVRDNNTGKEWVLLAKAPHANTNPEWLVPRTEAGIAPDVRLNDPSDYAYSARAAESRYRLQHGEDGPRWWVQDPDTGAVGAWVALRDVTLIA